MSRDSLTTAVPPFANAHCLPSGRQLRGSIAEALFLFAAVLLNVFCFSVFSEEIPFTGEEPPKIIKLSSSEFVRIENPRFVSTFGLDPENEETQKIKAENEIWTQYQKDLERYNRIKNYPKNLKRNFEGPEALFYVYTVKKDPEKYLDTFNGLYARFQTRQSTLASINRLSNPLAVKTGEDIILPVMQGLFIPKNPESTLEILLQKEYSSKITENTLQYEIDGTVFYFLPDESFSQTVVAFFHDNGMQLPLSKKVITSQFGYRISPVSGQWKLHAGIDLAAPVGTEVFACKHGVVSEISENHPLYGKYIDIRHDSLSGGKPGKTVSRYAHLSKILVKKGERVSTGRTIGLVGTTGASTGPHLHFEVRENGTPQDPLKVISNK